MPPAYIYVFPKNVSDLLGIAILVAEPVPSATEFSCSALAFEPIATLPTSLAFACVQVAIAPFLVALEFKPVEIEP